MTAKFTLQIQVVEVMAVQDSKLDSPYRNDTYYLKSTVPVSTAITSVCIVTVEEYRQDYPDDPAELIGSQTLTVNFTIPAGSTESNKKTYTTGGIGNFWTFHMDSKTHTQWNNQTFGNMEYKLKEDHW